MQKTGDDGWHLLALAEREERLLAQELHDTICQSLLGLSLLVQLAVKAKASGNEVGLGELETIRAHLDAAIEQSRIFTASQVLATHREQLPAVLLALSNVVSLRVPCHFEADAELPHVATGAAQLLYRIARETLQRIVKVTEAKEIEIRLRRADRALVLEISFQAEPSPDAAAGVYEGDGMLKRICQEAGVGWGVDTSLKTSVLRCTCGKAPFSHQSPSS